MSLRSLKTIFVGLSVIVAVFSASICPVFATSDVESNLISNTAQSSAIQGQAADDDCAPGSSQHSVHCLIHCSHVGLFVGSGMNFKIADPSSKILPPALIYTSYSFRPEIEPPIRA